jgi:FixJ family two-component response regulator
MENELSLVIDALPAMAWTARDDCTQDERWWLSSSAREHHFRLIVDGIPASLMTPTGELELVNRSLNTHHEASVMAKLALVSVVDDDESVRESLPDLLRQLGYAAQAFSSAKEFLASDYLCQTRCLILDVVMPGMSGPDLQRELMLRRKEIPIVFMTAHMGVRPRLLEQGAVECLLKPFNETALREALNAALGTIASEGS